MTDDMKTCNNRGLMMVWGLKSVIYGVFFFLQFSHYF